MKTKILLILLFFGYNVKCQQKSVTNFGKRLLDQGFAEFSNNHNNKAISIFENAAKKFIVQKNYAEMLHAYALIYGVLNAEAKQKQFLKYEKGILPYLKDNNLQVISICNCLGGAYQDASNFEKAQFYFEIAIKKIKSQKKSDDELLYYSGTNYNLLSALNTLFGDFNKAIINSKLSLNSFMSIKSKMSSDSSEISNQYLILANLYIKINEAFQAKNILQNSKKYIQKSDIGSLITYHQQNANIYKPSILNKPDSSLKHINIALKLQQSNNLKNMIGKSYEILGNIQFEMKDFINAQKSYQKSLNIRLPQGTNQTISSSYKNIANALYQQKRHINALNFYQKALQFCSKNFPENDFAKNPKIEQLKFKNDAIEIYNGKIMALIELYKNTKKTSYLKWATDAFDSMDQLLDNQRNSFQLEGSKLFFSDAVHDKYALGIEIAFENYKLTNNKAFLLMAFNYSEKNRAQVLYQAVRNSNKTNFNGVPKNLIQKEFQLEKQISVFEGLLNGDDHKYAELQSKLLSIIDELDKLKKNFQLNYPAYYNFKYITKPINVAEVQSKLKPNQSFIEYFVGNTTLYTFIINHKNFEFQSIAINGGFNNTVGNFQKALQTISKPKDLLLHANNLYNLVLKNSYNNIKNANSLIIAPDGLLYYIPFESLVIKPTINLKEKGIFLIEKMAVSYISSASMHWGNVLNYDSKTNPINYIGFAPKYNKTQDLPINRDLVEKLASKFSGKAFIGNEATLNHFENIEGSKVLHLSMHGDASDSTQMGSYLNFVTDSLRVNDIYGLKLQSDLVLLDACKTGYGMINKSEGLMNLARAFFYAGCKCITMSLWNLTSRAETSEIIRDFVVMVENGIPKNEALRNAKLNYLTKYQNDLNLLHPFFWSSLIMYGDFSPITKTNNHYIGVFLVLILIAILIYYRQQVLNFFK